MRDVLIRFTREYAVKAVDGPVYQAGSVHRVREDSAQHFIRRNAAELFVPDPEAEAEAVLDSTESEPVGRTARRRR